MSERVVVVLTREQWESVLRHTFGIGEGPTRDAIRAALAATPEERPREMYVDAPLNELSTNFTVWERPSEEGGSRPVLIVQDPGRR